MQSAPPRAARTDTISPALALHPTVAPAVTRLDWRVIKCYRLPGTATIMARVSSMSYALRDGGRSILHHAAAALPAGLLL